MEPEAKYTLVGTVVLVLVALIVAAAIWLRSTGGERDEPYKIYFSRQSLEGLQIRSDVKMLGIKVGSVSAFKISSRRPGSVEVFIRVVGTTPVRQSTQAMVERNLLTGIANIRLVNPTEDSPLLTAVQPDEPFPVIAEGESDYSRFAETFTQVAQRVDEAMQRVNKVLSDENQATFTELLVNLRDVSARAETSLASLDRTLASAGRAADEVRTMSAGITGETRRLATRYDTLGEETTRTVKEVSVAIKQMSADVSRLSTRVDALVADGNYELRVTAQALRSTADSLGATARRFGDPGRILFGPPKGNLGPGEGSK
jgi:phospholipid/cholesterol/gamma-HCH transport system substrate-binding protein